MPSKGRSGWAIWGICLPEAVVLPVLYAYPIALAILKWNRVVDDLSGHKKEDADAWLGHVWPRCKLVAYQGAAHNSGNSLQIQTSWLRGYRSESDILMCLDSFPSGGVRYPSARHREGEGCLRNLRSRYPKRYREPGPASSDLSQRQTL